MQAAYENTLGMMLELFAGADLFGAGLLDSVTQMSLEELVGSTRCSAWSAACCAAWPSTASTSPSSSSAGSASRATTCSPDTRASTCVSWQAQLSETGTYEAWRQAGSRTTAEAAQARVDELFAGEAPPLPADLGREFDDIIAAAQR